MSEQRYNCELRSIAVPNMFVAISMHLRTLRGDPIHMVVDLYDFLTIESPDGFQQEHLNALTQMGAGQMAHELYGWVFEGTAKPKWFASITEGLLFPDSLSDLRG